MTAVVFDYNISEQTQKNASSLLKEVAEVRQFSEMVSQKNYSLSPNIKRCVFVTGFDSGVMGNHCKFVQENKNILSWIISVVDIQHENIKKQLLPQIDNLFFQTDVLYEILFDDGKTFEKTKEAYLKPLKEKKLFAVLSNNNEHAKEAADFIKSQLVDWDVVIENSGESENCSYANAVVIVGKNPEDFEVAALPKKIKNRFIWIYRDRCNSTSDELNDTSEQIELVLSEKQWGFSEDTKQIFVSQIRNERYFQKYSANDITCVGLKNDSNFVMWDIYGLPALPEDYTEEKVKSFFNENCKFSQVLNKLK